MVRDKQYIFIVGNPRSGTTLLRNILGLHPDISIMPELHFFDRIFPIIRNDNLLKNLEYRNKIKERILDDVKNKQENGSGLWEKINIDIIELENKLSLVRSFREIYIILINFINTDCQVNYIVEKTPINSLFLKEINDYFPTAKIIYIVRDGREMCASASKIWKNNYIHYSARWQLDIKEVEKISKDFGNRFIEIKYEDLVKNTFSISKNIFSFIGVKMFANFNSDLNTIPASSSFDVKDENKIYESRNFEKFFNKKEKIIINTLLKKYLIKKNYKISDSINHLINPIFYIKFYYQFIKIKLYFYLIKKGYFFQYKKIKKLVIKKGL